MKYCMWTILVKKFLKQITCFRNERGDITTHPTDVKGTKSEYYTQFYANKIDDLMWNGQIPRKTEIIKKKWQIWRDCYQDVELVVFKSFTHTHTHTQPHGWMYGTFKEALMPVVRGLFQKTGEGQALGSSLMIKPKTGQKTARFFVNMSAEFF